MGAHAKIWGAYVETFDNGDKPFCSYQGAGKTKDGALVTGANQWQVIGGTGKMNALRGWVRAN